MSIIKIYMEAELPSPSQKEVLRYARAGGDSSLEALAQSAIEELSNTLTPRVCYAETTVKITDTNIDLGFHAVESKALSKSLNGCTSAIIFAATIGLSPDRLVAKHSRLSPTKALFIQAVGAERIEALCDVFEEEARKDFAGKGKILRPRFSPGYGDLPLSLQKEIFAFLSPEKIGISLGGSFLMTPTKSVTAIIGIKDEIK